MENTNLFNILNEAGITTTEAKTGDLLEKFGLNWKVEKEKLILPDGSDSGFFGIVRQDTRQTFATCKDTYEPYQNTELLELVNAAAGKLGIDITRAGKFKDGALIYLQLETGLINDIGENHDKIKKYVSAMNSHDGSLSLKWGLTNTTISCMNTFWYAVRDMENSLKHTTNMRNKIDQIVKTIEAAQEVERKLYDIYFKFAAEPLTKPHIEKSVLLALDIDLNKSRSDLSTYQINRLNDLSGAINGEVAQKGNTLWGLFSGITRYTSHLIPGTDIKRNQSKVIGKGNSMDNKVFNYLSREVTAGKGLTFQVN